MDQNKPKIIKFEDARKAARNIVASNEAQAQQQNSLFESLMKEVQEINPALGGFDELAVILSLPEDQFALIGPIFLDELQKSMNNIDDKMILIQAMNVSGTKLEDLQQNYLALNEHIDTQFAGVLSTNKRDFLKRLLGITYNCIAEAEGVAKRIVNVPIELTSENAKMPKYAHLGDGALDLGSGTDTKKNYRAKVPIYAAMAKLADALDLGSSGKPWRFESSQPHQQKKDAKLHLFFHFYEL